MIWGFLIILIFLLGFCIYSTNINILNLDTSKLKLANLEVKHDLATAFLF